MDDRAELEPTSLLSARDLPLQFVPGAVKCPWCGGQRTKLLAGRLESVSHFCQPFSWSPPLSLSFQSLPG